MAAKRKGSEPSSPGNSPNSVETASTAGVDGNAASVERQRRVAEAAYYRAERRGFVPGAEDEDWLEAEKEIDAGAAPRDTSRVNVEAPEELAYWTRRFGVPADRLKTAVSEVGVIVDDVERELKGSASGGQNAG